MSNFPERPPITCVPCILGNSHNNLCPMNGKECWFHLLYDLGDGGLVTKNVCAYFQNWYHDGPSTTICWVPTRWRRWILSLEDVIGWEAGQIFSSWGLPFLRLKLKLSGWGQANLQIRGQTFAWPGGCRYLQGTPDNVNHKNTRLQNCHLFYLYGIKYELGI